MTVDEMLSNGTDKMEKAVAALKKEFGQIRTGRANPLILDKVVVDYYGVPTPLRQMSQVSVQDGQTLVITPYDKSILKEIEKAMIKAELGITPNSDGVVIRLTFPPLTEDRRKEICKDVKKTAEDAKVAVRNIRRDMTDDLKKIEKEENLPEDSVKDFQDKIQKITDKYIKIIDDTASEKEKRGNDSIVGVLNFINNSTLRLITGVLIGFFVLGCVIAGGIPLMLLVMFVAFIGSKEYVDILKKKGFRPFLHLILLADICFVVLTALKRFDLVPVVLTLGTIGAFTLVLCKGRQPYIANVATTVLGFVYGGWLPCYVILLRQLNQDSLGFFTIKMCSGLGFLVLLFFTILMTDVGAYVCGSKFGKTPLAPVVSPKKTVEGAVGGSILALCTAMFIGWLIHIEWYQSLIAGFLITLFAQVGDLAESLIKRDAGVKDSGNSLPGHGGFLDRADSYLFSTPVAYFYFNYFVVSDQLTLDFISFARKALHAVGL